MTGNDNDGVFDAFTIAEDDGPLTRTELTSTPVEGASVTSRHDQHAHGGFVVEHPDDGEPMVLVHTSGARAVCPALARCGGRRR